MRVQDRTGRAHARERNMNPGSDRPGEEPVASAAKSNNALVPYLRQSRKKEVSISIEDQRREIKRWTAAQNPPVKLAPEVVEEGVSGSKPWRERELGRAVEACERGEAAGIIVAYQDRLSRENGLGTAEVWDALDRAGARLICAAEGLDTVTGDHEMLFQIKAAIAREQWKRYKANWANARRDAVERGVHLASVPVGYRANPTGYHPSGRPIHGPLLVDPATAPAITALFKLRAAGASWGECQALLLEHSIEHGRSLSATRKIVANKVYKGVAYGGDNRKEGAHQALVDPTTWRAAQPKQGAARQSEGALLGGLIRCASCGRLMTPGDGRYRCRPKLTKGAACAAPASCKAAEIDQRVEDFFTFTVAPALTASREAVTVDVSAAEIALASARAARESLWDLADDLTALDSEGFKQKLAEKVAAQQAAEDALRQAREAAGASSQIKSVLEAWPELPVAERRRWLKQFGCQVTARRGREHIGVRAHIVFGDHAYEGLEEYLLAS
jgi:DNA invertase Pin-like site-specific DNA recombinase